MIAQITDQAITVNINPRTFVTISRQRLRWENYNKELQTNYLDGAILSYFDMNHLKYNYAFESTQAGNIHLHCTIYVKTHDEMDIIDGIRKEFIALLPKMSKELQTRLWYQEACSNTPRWDAYVDKQKPRPLAVGFADVEDLSADERSDIFYLECETLDEEDKIPHLTHSLFKI